jgi:hypothetical protein
MALGSGAATAASVLCRAAACLRIDATNCLAGNGDELLTTAPPRPSQCAWPLPGLWTAQAVERRRPHGLALHAVPALHRPPGARRGGVAGRAPAIRPVRELPAAKDVRRPALGVPAVPGDQEPETPRERTASSCMSDVPRPTCGTGPRLRLCRRCRQQPRRPKQRWCKLCHRAYMKTYRVQAAERRRAEAWELAALRRQQRAAAMPEVHA